MKYQRKKIEFEFDAVQWHEDLASIGKIIAFMPDKYEIVVKPGQHVMLYVDTKKQGRRLVQFGEWVLKGYLGDIHVFTNEEFEARYEPLEDEVTP